MGRTPLRCQCEIGTILSDSNGSRALASQVTKVVFIGLIHMYSRAVPAILAYTHTRSSCRGEPDVPIIATFYRKCNAVHGYQWSLAMLRVLA